MDSLQELTGVETSSLLLGLSFFAVLVAVALTWPVCAVLLWRYRKAVEAGMRRRAVPVPAGPGGAPARLGPVDAVPAQPGPGAARSAPPRTPRIVVAEVGTPGPTPGLVRRAQRSARRAQLVLGAAGLLFGVGATAVYHLVEDLDWYPVRTVSLVLILGWLVVPTVIAVGVLDRRRQLLIWAGYLLLVTGLPVLGGTSVRESLLLLAVVVAFPGLFVLATGARTLQGAAWLVAPALAVLALAAVALLPLGYYVAYGVAFDRVAASLLAAAGGLLAALAAYGWTISALYERKWASDETLLVLQWWFVLALTLVLLIGTQGPGAAAGAMAPYALMLGFLATVAALRRRPLDPPVRLLLLRTFGARRRSSRLLRDLTVHWRWVGSVELIAGTDLATETLEPHEFLDYLRGRLRHRFVRDVGDVRRRVAELDVRPDRDGRFRVNELLCHDDTWRPALQALVGSVDAVLVDLRGLTAGNTGVVHELERLVALLPLRRVVALTDASTDQSVLRWALDRAAALAPPTAPVRTDPAPALRAVRTTGRRSADLRLVLDALGQAAAGSASGRPGTSSPGQRDRGVTLQG